MDEGARDRWYDCDSKVGVFAGACCLPRERLSGPRLVSTGGTGRACDDDDAGARRVADDDKAEAGAARGDKVARAHGKSMLAFRCGGEAAAGVGGEGGEGNSTVVGRLLALTCTGITKFGSKPHRCPRV